MNRRVASEKKAFIDFRLKSEGDSLCQCTLGIPKDVERVVQ